MEIFGIILSVPVAFVASLLYCFLLAKIVRRWSLVSHLLRWASLVVLVVFVVEIALLATVGAVRSRAAIGPLFYPAHLMVFFLGVPALANVLVLRRNVKRWYVAVPLCTLFALVLVLMQYGVSEALYGIDGDSGPFSDKVRLKPDTTETRSG